MKKVKGMNEKEFLALLQKVLPQATRDPGLAHTIYEQVAKEVQMRNHLQSFEKFCKEGSIPDTEPATVAELKSHLATNFGESNVTIVPDDEGKAMDVEIQLPDRALSNKIRIIPAEEVVEEVKVPFVPFPVALPEDPSLVWVLARREDLGPEDATRALSNIQEEFWLTKAGQKRLREIGDRSFAEFVMYVPAAALAESGMKRHYKEPEVLTTLRLLGPTAQEVAVPETEE